MRAKLAAAFCGTLVLAACAETDSSASGLSGTPDQFAAMRAPCIDQAARMTGLPKTSVTVNEQIQTGGGPLLTLSAGGTPYSCRLESDGSVTVFSEYAN